MISRWRIEQCSELSAVSASFVLSTPTETDGAVFPGRIMLANTCTWTYRGDECGYHGPAVADEYDQPTSASFPLTNFRSKSHDRDRISDSGARPAMCASGVVRLRGKHAGRGKIFSLREYLR